MQVSQHSKPITTPNAGHVSKWAHVPQEPPDIRNNRANEILRGEQSRNQFTKRCTQTCQTTKKKKDTLLGKLRLTMPSVGPPW